MMHLIDRYFIKQPKLRRFITRLLAGDRECDVQLLGATVRVHSVKEHGYLRSSRIADSSALFRDEVPIMIHLASLICDGDTFVDIGANVGIYSLTLARMRRILPNTRFYAFEANPDTFARLSVNIESLGVCGYNVALSDHGGSLEFVFGAVSNIFTTVENISSYSISDERISVPCRRLDEMAIEGDSLVLKVDVEGQERNVLDGALGLFRANRIKAVYLDGYKDRAIEDLLKGHGFSLLDGKTLESTVGGVFNLLAVRDKQRA